MKLKVKKLGFSYVTMKLEFVHKKGVLKILLVENKFLIATFYIYYTFTKRVYRFVADVEFVRLRNYILRNECVFALELELFNIINHYIAKYERTTVHNFKQCFKDMFEIIEFIIKKRKEFENLSNILCRSV